MKEIGILNWSIIIIYLLANLLLGFVLSKKVETAEDFYIGRKTTPWWAIGISVLATYVSAMTFLGAPAWSYKEGLSVIAIHLNYPLVIIAVMAFFVPFFMQTGVVSIYEYQEKRFGESSRVVISIIFLMTQLLSSAAVLYGSALVIGYITGISVILSIVIVTIITLIYTSLGGITAVIWTDVLQSFIFLVGGLIVLFVLLSQMPGTFSETLSSLKSQGKINPLDWSTDSSKATTVWAGIIAMSVYHVTVYGANQMMMQRTLGAKNMGDAKKSLALMGFAAFFIYFLFIFIGVLFYQYYEGRVFDNDNTIMLEFAEKEGFPGFIGVIAAAVLAASMSSLSSALNSFSTISTEGFYQKYLKPNETPEHYLSVARWSSVFWASLIVIPAIAFSNSTGSILELLTKVGSYFVGAKLSMYGLGFFSKHTTQRGLLIGVVAGFIALAYVATQTDIAWPWYAMIGAVTNIAVSIPASILLDGRKEEWSEYSVPGQKAKFKAEGLPEKENGWYVVPGKLDTVSYVLLAFFVATFLFLLTF
ncbi:MAG: SSS family solute:Na+ symporter [Saprospiraceae bacterium]|jgi:SSS family solute:Na+ symporter